MKEYDEIWAVEAEKIKEFFNENPGDVYVEQQPEKLIGTLSFPQTRIIIKGEGAEELYHKFFLNFMRGGG